MYSRTLIISILILIWPHSALRAQSVSFVQMTDPHCFDAGKHLLSQGAREEFINNRSALDWAILQTNKLEASGRRVDFVAITGGFGLADLKDDEIRPAAGHDRGGTSGRASADGGSDSAATTHRM